MADVVYDFSFSTPAAEVGTTISLSHVHIVLQASICDVAVDPAYQHRGIGRRIVKKLVEV